jgi:hypothetical protein
MIRIILAMVLLVGSASHGFAADCAIPDRNPQLEIVVDDGSVTYDFTRTRKQMIALPREMGATPPNHGGEPQGLTLNKLTLKIAAELNYRDIHRGSRCIYPGRIVLTISSEQHVFVDARYPEGSCERQAVLDHERDHIRINREAARAHEGALRRAVAGLLAAHPYYFVPVNQPPQDAYIGAIREVAKPILDAIKSDARRHHAELDSPDGYATIRARCSGW